MKAKALQNLKAGNLLFDRGLYDAAVSRYYYALLQACIHVLEARGIPPGTVTPAARRWGHPTVRARVPEIRDREEDERLFEEVRQLRESADYNPQTIGRWAVESCRREVERFVREVTG